jgi:hypothetical protein
MRNATLTIRTVRACRHDGRQRREPRHARLPRMRTTVESAAARTRDELSALRRPSAFSQTEQHTAQLGSAPHRDAALHSANLLPMMHTSSLFGSQSDTIMSGVGLFLDVGVVVSRADYLLRQHHGTALEDGRRSYCC